MVTEVRKIVLSFPISPANHIYCDLSSELATLGLAGSDPHASNMKEIIAAFKRKSFLLIPDKHSAIINAHTRFEHLNVSFLKLLDHFLELKDLRRSEVFPGELNTKKCEAIIQLREGSAKLWRTAITKAYKHIVAEPREMQARERRFSVIQRRNSIVETLATRQEWRNLMESLLPDCKDNFKPTNRKLKTVGIVGKTQYKFVQVTITNIDYHACYGAFGLVHFFAWN